MADKSNGNLRPPWPKGVSGNPKGRPKSKSFTRALKRLLRLSAVELMGLTLKDFNGFEFLAFQAIANAGKGKSGVLAQIVNRLEGRVPIKIEQPGNDLGEEPLPEDVAEAMFRAAKTAFEKREGTT
jgi:hypothetical protein